MNHHERNIALRTINKNSSWVSCIFFEFFRIIYILYPPIQFIEPCIWRICFSFLLSRFSSGVKDIYTYQPYRPRVLKLKMYRATTRQSEIFQHKRMNEKNYDYDNDDEEICYLNFISFYVLLSFFF